MFYLLKCELLLFPENTNHFLPCFVSDGPELDSCSDIYTVLEDSSIDLTCITRGYPKPEVTLYKDGEADINLENITRNEAGYYTVVDFCFISTFNLLLLDPPSQIFELEDSDFTIGSSVSLKCSATGNPRPEYYWTYFNATNVSEESDDGVSRLVIRNATTYNIGNYTCLAWNEHGNVSKTARLSVEGRGYSSAIIYKIISKKSSKSFKTYTLL
uniref:Ig-like domain-containing protein n=1 Tax=Neogobius melanostomus TaxID=47308 RepID=A0A8C6U6B1_9GOBI